MFKRNKAMRAAICFCALFVFGAALFAADTQFVYSGSQNYSLVERTDLRRYDNGKYVGLMSREARSFIVCEDGVYDGDFFVHHQFSHLRFAVGVAVQHADMAQVGAVEGAVVGPTFALHPRKNFVADFLGDKTVVDARNVNLRLTDHAPRLPIVGGKSGGRFLFWSGGLFCFLGGSFVICGGSFVFRCRRLLRARLLVCRSATRCQCQCHY